MEKTVENVRGIIRISRAGNARYERKPVGFPELSPRTLKRIARRMVESRDQTLYIIVVAFGRGRVLHYRAEDAGYGSHISMATLFKDRKVAEAVRRAIYGRRQRVGFKVVRVWKTKLGVRLVSRAELPRG